MWRVTSFVMKSALASVAPGIAQLRNYERKWLHSDVIAGVTVAAYLIPQVMAYGTLANLPPIVGLWAMMAPIVVYAAMGSSRQLSIGPESTTALMTTTALMPVLALEPMAGGDAARYAALAAGLALAVGAVCFVAGVARLGFLANMLSMPVMAGYMTGLATVMVASQLEKVTGIPSEGTKFVDQIREFVSNVAQVHWPTVVLSVAVLVMLLALNWWKPRLPGPLIGVLAASLVVFLFKLDSAHGIEVVGQIPEGLPKPTVPDVSWHDLSTLMVPACGITVVGFAEAILVARTFARKNGYELNPNAELRALGVCNVTAGMTQGFPVSCSGSRTTLGDAVNSRTQLYSLVMLVVLLAVMLFGRGVLSTFPNAALGALIVYAALRLIDVKLFRRLLRFRRSEFLLALSTTVAVLAFGVFLGVMIAIGLSIADLLRRVSHAHDSVLGFVPDLPGMHDVDDYSNAEPVPGLLVYRYDAPLCFANAEDFRDRALNAVNINQTPVVWFVLSAEANVEVDITSLDALDQLRSELTSRGIVFAMARVKQDLRDALQAAGLIKKIGEDRIFLTLPSATEAFENRHTQ